MLLEKLRIQSFVSQLSTVSTAADSKIMSYLRLEYH